LVSGCVQRQLDPFNKVQSGATGIRAVPASTHRSTFFEGMIMDRTDALTGMNPGSNSTTTTSPTPASGLGGSVESAGASLHSTIDKAARPLHSTVDRVSTAAHETVDKLASSASNVADRFSDQTRRVTEAPSRAVDFSKSWVQERPLEAVGAALALGFILGRLTSR
jgi:ElaB/YqjD/DUF883 family membrane-anchored ribosome-binding protein